MLLRELFENVTGLSPWGREMPDDGAGRYRVSLRRSESSAACLTPQEFLTIVRASDAAGARREAETLVKTLHGDFDILEIRETTGLFGYEVRP
jgi:hypothetical protein